MASLNTSTNGQSIKSSYQGVINSPTPSGSAASSPTYAQWAIFSVSAPLVTAFQQDSGSKESVLKVQSTGEGELVDLVEDFSEGRIQFAFVKVKDPNTTLPKYVLIGWCGEGVPERTKGYFTSHLAAVSKVFHGYHVQITARSDRDLTPEGIVQKVADASGSKYSAGTAPTTASAPAPAPPVASKPVFLPTRSAAASNFNPLANSRSRQSMAQDGSVDEDGWGADAPPVTRSQLEKVQPAYQPTRVNMAELTKQTPSVAPISRTEVGDSETNVVKGGYQPVGKVDIAAIRAQAQSSNDDRPTPVKGSYEPVGKVDIAAIRARAQKPTEDTSSEPTPSEDGEARQKSLAERSTAFNQSERLTTLPKPKVAHKFGSNTSSFTGTKAPTPGTYGLQSAPSTAAAAPIGAASRTFADEGGKTPAQIWAEKKARERGLSGATEPINPQVTSPIKSQASGGGEWKSGYKGKSWAPVPTNPTGRSASGSIGQQRTGDEEHDHEEEDAPTSPAGGISALRDRFKGAAPMGAPGGPRGPSDEPSPPTLNAATKPSGGVAMPGFQARQQLAEEHEEETSGPNIPPPPPAQRMSDPEEEEEEEPSSPVRIAMPVARSKETEIEAPEERFEPPVMPVRAVEEAVPDETELTDQEPARGAAFGHEAASSAHQESHASGKRALVQFDYEKAEDNEIELAEGEYVTNIEMVDEDWWMGTNTKGESGLFPSNYVELVEVGKDGGILEPTQPARHDTIPPAPAAGPAPSVTGESASGPTATALYDYEAAEDNELTFPEGATITGLEFPDDDWWLGQYDGRSGLFPSNYVQLNE